MNLAHQSSEDVKPFKVNAELQHEMEQFLYHEAELLDDRRFVDWIALMTNDLRYLMPIRSNRSDRDMAREYSLPNELNFFDESKTSLLFRLRKLQSGQAWAESPPSRTRHLISNVRIAAGENSAEFVVKSCFLLYRTRLERQLDTFAGERIDVIRRDTSALPGFRIRRRTIHLDQATLLSANLSIFF